MPDRTDRLIYRFGTFRFDARSGELTRIDSDRRRLVRLSPQPARLLVHLIERRPDLVTREELRQLLWPEVEVDYEQSLHTVVRQVRSALEESASEPCFIETIAKRGYRFLGAATRESPEAGSPVAGARRLPRPVFAFAAALVVAFAVLSLQFYRDEPAPLLRIAVMPFEPLDDDGVLPPGNDLAESLVEALANRPGQRLEVIGPTTTEAYDARPQRIRELFDELDVDLVVNARDSRGEQGVRVLIEVIRAADGGHVWVRYLDELPTDQDPVELIVAGVGANLP